MKRPKPRDVQPKNAAAPALTRTAPQPPQPPPVAAPDPAAGSAAVTEARRTRKRRTSALAALAIVMGITAGVVAGSVVANYRPQQVESARIVLVQANTPGGDCCAIASEVGALIGGDTNRTLLTAAGLLTGDQINTKAAAMMGGSMSAKDISKAVVVEPIGESNLLAVRARAANEQAAKALVDAYTTVAVGEYTDRVRTRAAARLLAQPDRSPADAKLVQRYSIEGDRSVTSQGDVGATTRTVGFTRPLYLALGAFAGLLGGLAIAVLLLGGATKQS